MRAIWILSIFLLGCSSKVTQDDLKHLNGYWEIEKVTFPNGQTKDFMTNTTIDYIELKGMEGFRKKVQPKFNGSFETSNDAELFTISAKEGRFTLLYRNGKNTREEQLSVITENRFSVTNSDTLSYAYKRYQPLKIDE